MGDEQNKTAIKKKPIDKEYLKSSLKDFDSEILENKYIKSENQLLHTHANKEVLDKLSASDSGTLLFDGNEISNSNSSASGKSAYEIAVDHGFEGTETEWLTSLRGETGSIGEKGETGESGSDGLSAYQIAINNGFEGTESEWLSSLKGNNGINGVDGTDGKSAFQLAQKNGFEGTEQEWLESLKGAVTQPQKTIYVTVTSIQYNGIGSKDEPLVGELVFQDLPYVENNNWLLDVYIEPFTVSLVNASYENNTASSPTSVTVNLDPSTCTTINNGDFIKVIGKIYLSELG